MQICVCKVVNISVIKGYMCTLFHYKWLSMLCLFKWWAMGGGGGESGWGFDLLGKPQSMTFDMIISHRGADI